MNNLLKILIFIIYASIGVLGVLHSQSNVSAASATIDKGLEREAQIIAIHKSVAERDAFITQLDANKLGELPLGISFGTGSFYVCIDSILGTKVEADGTKLFRVSVVAMPCSARCSAGHLAG